MRSRRSRSLALAAVALAGVVLAVGVTGARFATMDVGSVGVVRNGGPFDDRGIRQVLLPGAQLTWIGFFSEGPHRYPSAGVTRTYVVTSDASRASRPGVHAVRVPTKDGVEVDVEATVFLHFVGERDYDVLERFETTFGDRRLPTRTGKALYPWEGEAGFAAWLDAYFRPVLVYTLQRELGKFQCAALVASCGLVSRGVSTGRVEEADAGAIGDRVSKAVERDLTRTLGQPYLWGIKVRIERVTLPPSVQAAVDSSQAEFAAVNVARAKLRQARYQAAAYRLLGDALNRSPGLVKIETMKALPNGATVATGLRGHEPLILTAGGALPAQQPAGGPNPVEADGDSAEPDDGSAGERDGGPTSSASE
jgi:regulator of protease activity HflC (stomatin/prohibitin superfamily)